MKKATLILLSFLISLSVFSQDITGSWNGVLKVQGIQLRLVINIQQAESGYSATMDSPDQGAKGIPVDWATFINDTLKFEVKQMGITYTGLLSEDHIIKGTFTQMGMSLPLDFSGKIIEKEKKCECVITD